MATESSIQYQAHCLLSYISDDKGIGTVCDKVARERSGTKYWTADEFEKNEDTPKFDLYWSVYAETQVKIVVLALSKVANCHLS